MTSRIKLFDGFPYPYGWGCDRSDPKTDVSEPLKLVSILGNWGSTCPPRQRGLLLQHGWCAPSTGCPATLSAGTPWRWRISSRNRGDPEDLSGPAGGGSGIPGSGSTEYCVRQYRKSRHNGRLAGLRLLTPTWGCDGKRRSIRVSLRFMRPVRRVMSQGGSPVATQGPGSLRTMLKEQSLRRSN